MKFSYKALNAQGKKQKGKLTAESDVDAIAVLREMGLVPIALVEQSMHFAADGTEAKNIFQMELSNTDIHKKKLPRKKLIAVFSQMAIMLKAGVNFSMVIEVLGENEPNPYMRRILREMHNDLMAGVPISQSMDKFAAFDNVTVSIVRAGEADGHLERSFAQVARLIEKQNTLVAKVQSAAIYPCILLVLVIGVVILLNVMVLPTFISMFQEIDKDLPGMTKVLMAVSLFLSGYWYILIIVIMLIVSGYIFSLRKYPRFAIFVDKLKLRIPLAGMLIRNSQTARFARVLSTLLESGQDFLTAFGIAQSVLSNAYMSTELTLAADEIRMGNPVSVSMAKLPFFEPVLISMVRAGEESGSLSETLSKMAEMYEEQTDENTKRITTMMEPMMTIVIAIIVGFVVIALVMPMFGMFDLVGNV